MKNIIYSLLLLSFALMSCEDFNEANFPGYKDKPVQITTAGYQLTNADYKTISTTAVNTATANYKRDSLATVASTTWTQTQKDSIITALKAALTTLKTQATNVTNNQSFSANDPASVFIPYLMPMLYKYADPSSAITATYRTTEAIDAVAYNVAYKDTVKTADYQAMGTTAGKPGFASYFSTTIDPNAYLPAFCKTKHPYAAVNEVASVVFQWFVSTTSTVTLTRYYKFDGTIWAETGKMDQFILGTDYTWVFDPTITFSSAAVDYKLLMTYLNNKYLENGGLPPSTIIVPPATTAPTTPTPLGFAIPQLEGYNDWTSTTVGRYIINWKFPPTGSDVSNVRTEFYFGTSWYYNNIDIRATARTYADDVELHNFFGKIDSTSMSSTEKTAAKTEFMEKRVVQGLALVLGLKYPNLVTDIKGIPQFVQIRVEEYDGARKYWTYRYQSMGNGKFKYISRTKWK